MKTIIICCLLLSYQSKGFGSEINSSKIKTNNKIKHHYVEKVANTILARELGLTISVSNSCSPEPIAGLWVCYVFEENKQVVDSTTNEYNAIKERLWSLEINFIKGEYDIYKGSK